MKLLCKGWISSTKKDNVGREPGKCCLPKWYIENINDYIALMLYISLVLDSKNIQFHIISSFYYSISINSTEVDPNSNSPHNGVVKPRVL